MGTLRLTLQGKLGAHTYWQGVDGAGEPFILQVTQHSWGASVECERKIIAEGADLEALEKRLSEVLAVEIEWFEPPKAKPEPPPKAKPTKPADSEHIPWGRNVEVAKHHPIYTSGRWHDADVVRFTEEPEGWEEQRYERFSRRQHRSYWRLNFEK